MNKKGGTIYSFSVICILGMFLVMSLMLIMLGAGFYQKITDKVNANDQIRTSVNYIANKVRFSEMNNLSVKNINDVKVLEIEQEGYIDLIYFYNGSIMEVSVAGEEGFMPEFGTSIIKTESFDFDIDESGFIAFYVNSENIAPVEFKVYWTGGAE